jgi:hypothetical protein
VGTRDLSWDYATSAEMILRYMDAKILPGYAAIERGSLFGYSFFVYEQSKGVIGDLFVRDAADGARSVTRWKNACLPTSSRRCNSRPASIAWRRSCWRTNTGEVARPFLQRVSAGIRACS